MIADTLDWSEANQRFMSAQLASLKSLLSLEATAESASNPAEPMAVPSALDVLTELFDLTPFERSILLLCAGVEMDHQLSAACARLNPDHGRGCVTFGLALSRLPEPHWSALTPVRPLRRWRLLDIDAGPLLVESPLRIDERILHFLAGMNLLDVRLHAIVAWRRPAELMASDHAAVADRLSREWNATGTAPPVIHLSGDDISGQEDVAAALANSAGLHLLSMQQQALPASPTELDTLLTLCEREARLLSAAMLVGCGDSLPVPQLAVFAEQATMPLIVAGREPLRLRRAVLTEDVNKPAPLEQKRLWLAALGEPAMRLNGRLDAIAGQFRLSAGNIAAISDSLSIGGVDDSLDARLWHACRAGGRRRLDDLAERITPRAGWDDLVLPESPLATLRQIAAHVRQRTRVHDEWGFGDHGRRSGVGVSALFCGESGTGKTLAAEVIARELGLDLYRIDLSSVVSKYIGDTEKNLRRVFDAAEDSGSMLLFDEADALFGKRSEVKDSHDRYANIEISYLLQRMEAYRGLAILTTNLKASLDRAFQRRLRFVVTFPFPDSDCREAIWRRMFPSATPLGKIDYRALARVNLPGGHIRNIALNAAFLAADEATRVEMTHLLAAARTESAKLERPLSEAETRGWA